MHGSALYQDWLSHSAIAYCRNQLSELRRGHINNLDDVGQGRGRAVSVIQSELDSVGRFVGIGFSDPVADSAKLVFAFGYMLIVEPLVTLVALVFFLPQFIFVPLLQQVLNQLVRKKTDLLRAMADGLSNMQPGAEELPDTLVENTRGVFDNEMKTTFYKQLIKMLINFLNALAPLSVLVFGGYQYIQGETTLGVIVSFMSGFGRMADPTRALVYYYRIASIRNQQHDKVAQWIRKRQN